MKSFGIVFSPIRYNLKLIANNSEMASYLRYSHMKFNYNIGMQFQFDFSKKYTVRSGIEYSTKGFICKYKLVDSSATNVIFPSRVPIESNLDISYLDIPLTLGLKITNNEKLKIQINSGIITGFLIHKKERSFYLNGTERISEHLNKNLRKILFTISFGCDLEYHCFNKLYLSFGKFIGYGVNKIDEDLLKSNTFSYGCKIGLSYKIINN